MTEKIQKLVRMANQVADFFAAYPEEKAVAGVQEHLRSFWTPNMRKELAAYAETDGKGMRPHVVAAIKKLNPAASRPEKAVADPEAASRQAGGAG